jgi:hypothetical protein
MLAALITLAHFSVSPATSFPKSVGEPAGIVPPISVNRALIFGSASAALVSLLSFSMIASGVFLGARAFLHALAAGAVSQTPATGFDIELDLSGVSHSQEQAMQFLGAFRAGVYDLLD